MKSALSRRRFLGGASAAGASCLLASAAGTQAAPAAAPTAAAPAAPPRPALPWPVAGADEEAALVDVLRSGRWGRTAGGRHVAEFEALFARRMQAKHCIATSSGTTALMTALGALEVGPGDEVVLPPYTFVATFNAITQSYALPVFADTDAASFQVDPRAVDAAITPATKVLLPVHIGGSPADLTALTTIAAARKVTLVEDACQAILAEWEGRPVGTRGIGGCFSFQASKNLTAGEGGAVLTNDDAFANLCYNVHTPGNAKPGPLSGRAANFRLTEFQGALLRAQYARLEEQSARRDGNAAYLNRALAEIPGITPARLTAGCTRSGWHLYMFRYDARRFEGLSRARFLKELARQGVAASGGYTALNTSPHVRALAANPHYRRIYGAQAMDRWLERTACPVNDRLVEEAVWFSQTKLLEPRASLERAVDIIRGIQTRAGELARG